MDANVQDVTAKQPEQTEKSITLTLKVSEANAIEHFNFIVRHLDAGQMTQRRFSNERLILAFLMVMRGHATA